MLSNYETIRFGLVGAGAIAKAHVEAMRAADGIALAGVADVNEAAARELAGDVPVFASLDAMIAGCAPDAVLICTPPDTHPALAIAAAKAGLHILCEKPLAIGLREAQTMVDAASRAGVVLTMATKFRYVPDLARARNAIRLGALGNVTLVRNAFESPVQMAGRWNTDRLRSGGGVLIDNGTHSVDVLRFLLGPIESVSCSEGERTQGLPVDETVRLYARAESGAFGIVDLSWSRPSASPWFVEIVGTRGRIEIGWRESRHRFVGDAEDKPFGNGYDKVRAFIGQLENFRDGLRGDAPIEVASADALASVAAIDAAYEALGSRLWTKVADPAYVRA